MSAGINTNTFDLDADGIDRHCGVNFLGQFYAINLLYPLIRKTSKIPDEPPPRIVFEASEVHRMAHSTIHFGSLEEINDKEFSPTHLYARSKLAMILCAKFLLPEKVFKKNGDHVLFLERAPGYRQYHHATAMEGCISGPFRKNAVLGYDNCREGYRTGIL